MVQVVYVVIITMILMVKQQQMPEAYRIVWKWETVEHKNLNSMEDKRILYIWNNFPFV